MLTCIKCITSGAGQASSALACRCAPLHCVDLSYRRERIQAPLCFRQLILLHFVFINLEMSFIVSIYRNGTLSMQALHGFIRFYMHYYYVSNQCIHTEWENLLNDYFSIVQLLEACHLALSDKSGLLNFYFSIRLLVKLVVLPVG